jgi:hypothetical protein
MYDFSSSHKMKMELFIPISLNTWNLRNVQKEKRTVFVSRNAFHVKKKKEKVEVLFSTLSMYSFPFSTSNNHLQFCQENDRKKEAKKRFFNVG